MLARPLLSPASLGSARLGLAGSGSGLGFGWLLKLSAWISVRISGWISGWIWFGFRLDLISAFIHLDFCWIWFDFRFDFGWIWVDLAWIRFGFCTFACFYKDFLSF